LGEAVVADYDAPPVFDPGEDVLDLVALAVEGFVVGYWILRFHRGGMHGLTPRSVRAVRNQSLS
jgi:hypothetical protein